MSEKPPLSEQFAYPTMRQHHDTASKNKEALWDTAIGRRNYHITVEKFIAAQLSNPEVFCCGDFPDPNAPGSDSEYGDIIGEITATAFDCADMMYGMLEERQNEFA